MAEHPLKVVLDTSVYIPFINQGIAHPAFELEQGRPLLYMSAVVLEELYVGAHDPTSVKLLDKLYETFTSVDRFIVPDASDWQRTGRIVAKLGQKYGFEDRYLTRVTHDVLIASSARRFGAAVVTKNGKDFRRIGEFLDFKFLV